MNPIEMQALVDFLATNGPRFDAPLPVIRNQFDAMTSALKPPAECAVEPVSAGDVPSFWVTPRNAAADKVVFYLHGGGYLVGSAGGFTGFAGLVGEACQARALVVDYRLAPEHPFPAALDDAVTAYRWLLSQNIAANGIVVAGDSAGGGLAVALVAALRELQLPLPAAVSLVSPWVDFKMEGKSITTKSAVDPSLTYQGLVGMAQAYFSGNDVPARMDLLGNPLEGFPPVLIQVGSHEILLDDSLRLAARCAADNVGTVLRIWPGMIHDWPLFAQFLSDGREAIAQIGAFAQRHVHRN